MLDHNLRCAGKPQHASGKAAKAVMFLPRPGDTNRAANEPSASEIDRRQWQALREAISHHSAWHTHAGPTLGQESHRA